jgi:hypothetical protein
MTTEVGEKATRLKMVVNTVKMSADQDGNTQSEEITLSAVYSDKEGSVNKQWAKWTPAGNLSFTVSNPNVFGRILPGQFYMVDLTRCDKDAI